VGNFTNFENVDVTACKVEDADGDLATTDDQTAVMGWPVYLSIDSVRQEPGAVTEEPDGCYTWTNLGPGYSYDVEEDVLPNWFALTPTSWDFGPAVSGETYSYTFINSEYVTKSGLKWRDYNLSGDRDELIGDSGALEPVIPGWYVQLWTYDGGTGLPVTFVDRVMTDAEGVYTFGGIMPGEDYIVCEERWDEFWYQTYPTLQTVPPEGEGVASCPAFGEGGALLGPVGWTFTAMSGDVFTDNDFGNNRAEGCTLTQGYWKTHSSYGPAPYDDTWELIGEDTQFFGNYADPPDNTDPITWYEIMQMPPKKGNAYIILSYQYIAAQLNFLAGADPSAVLTEFGQAATLLSTYTWDYDWKADPAGVRDQFISLASTLDEYNNGYIGPGHCED
jgi:hypothetical protein